MGLARILLALALAAYSAGCSNQREAKPRLTKMERVMLDCDYDGAYDKSILRLTHADGRVEEKEAPLILGKNREFHEEYFKWIDRASTMQGVEVTYNFSQDCRQQR